MTETTTKTKYPKAVYAAAGVGDFVYEQLRKLQDRAIEFGAEAGAQAPQWRKKVAELATTVDAGKVRETVVTSTQFAADKAGKFYGILVTRGEKAFAATAPKATRPAHTPAHTPTQAPAQGPARGPAQAPTQGKADAPEAPVAKKAEKPAEKPVAPVAKKVEKPAAPRKTA